MRISGIMTMFKNRRSRKRLYCTPEYWDSKAVEMEDSSVSMWPNNHLNYYYHHQETLPVFQRHLPNVDGMCVLDVGCGTGRISNYLAGRGAKVQGIDFSQKSLDIALKTSQDGNPKYRLQSIFDLDEQAVYDLAVSWGCLVMACKNVIELRDALERIRKALKPGGRVLLMEPIHKGFLHRVLDLDLQRFCLTMEESGFEIESITQMHFWPTRLLLAYVQWPKFITAPGYYLGQAIMRILGGRFGDYQSIYATVC